MNFIRRLLQWLMKPAGQQDAGQKEAAMSENYDPQVLLARLKDVMDTLEWKYGEDARRLTLLTASGGKHGTYFCVLQVHSDYPLLAFYSHVQCRAPEEKRPAMAEFVTRANYGLWLGNFELDMRDGEIRYKTSLQLADADLTAGMLNALLRSNTNTIDRYLPGVLSVLWNDIAPEDAVRMVEAG